MKNKFSSEQLHAILHRYWGYDTFRYPQEEIIMSVLDGNDTLGLMPTGGGKSLTFQVPAMMLDGLTVVITPLISLMKDQVDTLRARDIPATYLFSGLSSHEQKLAIEKCRYGKTKILYLSPEKLCSGSFLEIMRHLDISLIVVDEAHCISQWGYDFRPSYLKIKKLRDIHPNVPILALTASATPAVADDICLRLGFKENTRRFTLSFARPNISFIVRPTESKDSELTHILSATLGSAIVYV
ncbi:MAG: RecQ family ATP-dependent DNA helicase, partial [Muribaculaceae bacterium]|nr:RecQ family ATP-dependent DNA helicase [Muribaculaceae bacterium]